MISLVEKLARFHDYHGRVHICVYCGGEIQDYRPHRRFCGAPENCWYKWLEQRRKEKQADLSRLKPSEQLREHRAAAKLERMKARETEKKAREEEERRRLSCRECGKPLKEHTVDGWFTGIYKDGKHYTNTYMQICPGEAPPVGFVPREKKELEVKTDISSDLEESKKSQEPTPKPAHNPMEWKLCENCGLVRIEHGRYCYDCVHYNRIPKDEP